MIVTIHEEEEYQMAQVVSAKIVSNVLTIVYDEAMTLADINAITFQTSSGGVLSPINFTGDGTNTWAITLDASIATTDWIVAISEYGAIRSSSYQYLQGTMFIGGEGNTSIDMYENNTFNTYPHAYFTNGGSDTINTSPWNRDLINLNETTAASDTVKFGDQWMDDPVEDADIIVGYDVSGTTTNDKLNMLSGVIAANVTNANGVDVGSIATHTISGGIATFKDALGVAITIDTEAELLNAYDYLHTNIAAAGTTVAFRADGDLDALIVFQKGVTGGESFVVALDGINGVTLSNSAGTNKVYIQDTTGPMVGALVATSTGTNLYFSETVASVTTIGIKLYKNGSTDMGTLTKVINGATVSLNSSTTTLASTDFIVMSLDSTAATNTATDSIGNIEVYVPDAPFKIAAGADGDSNIDLATLVGVNEAFGGAGNDILRGTTGNDMLCGETGNDTLYGNAGDDELEAGYGDDVLYGEAGSDYLQGDRGNDTLDGGYESDGSADNMDGGYGNDTYILRDTNDRYWEGNADILIGGNDTVQTYITSMYLNQNVENIHIMSTGIANATGNELDNTIYAGSGDNVMDGGAGRNALSYIYASSGVSIDLNSTSAQATGGSGTDTIYNFQDLYGSNYNDVLRGNSTGNNIYGNAGNDTMYAGSGDHYMNGGLGTDLLTYVSSSAGVSVNLALTTAQYTGGSGTDQIANFETLHGSNYNDILRGNSGVNTLKGNAGNDVIYADAGTANDIMDGGLGTDTLSYLSATAAVNVNLALTTSQNTLGAGYDTITTFETLHGSNYNDILRGNSGVNTLKGNAGNDVIYADAGTANDIMDGGLGTDTLS
ncbi:MAG: serralysin, partial [Campylobacterota bacterium]|nr:serralysin [Campylobacterota bacterium]